MATPLNVFRTVTVNVADSDTVIYTAPTGVTSIVLMAQCANVTDSDGKVTFSHFDTSETNQTELVKNFDIAPNDANALITGKLVVEEGDKVKVFADRNNQLKLTLSILESTNA
jgi:Cu/Ag efflux protein CusF